MIQKTVSYQVGDALFPSLDAAQRAEIATIIRDYHAQLDKGTALTAEYSAEAIVTMSDKVLNILSTKANSRPRARRANGATRKPRKPIAVTLTPAQASAAGLA